jgi:hypothetical protein
MTASLEDLRRGPNEAQADLADLSGDRISSVLRLERAERIFPRKAAANAWVARDDEPPYSPLGAPPPASRLGPSEIDAFLDELGDDGLDLTLRLLVVDSLAAMLPMAGANLRFFAEVASIGALRDALQDVCARVSDRRLSRLIAPDAPLGAYVKGLFLRAGAVARALERHGFDSLGGATAVDGSRLAQVADDAAAFHFRELRDSIRRDVASLRLERGSRMALGALEGGLGRLFAAVDRLDRVEH